MSTFRRRLMMTHRDQEIIHFHDPEVKRILVAKYGGATGGELGNVPGHPGEMTHKQALQITRIGPALSNSTGEGGLLSFNNKIVSLEDLKYLRNLKRIDLLSLVRLPNLEYVDLTNIEYAGYNLLAWCHKLKEIRMPNLREFVDREIIVSLKSIETIDIGPFARKFQWLNFYRIPTLKNFVLRAKTPPEAPAGWLGPTEFPEPWMGKIYVPDESVELYRHTENYSVFGEKIRPLSEYE